MMKKIMMICGLALLGSSAFCQWFGSNPTQLNGNAYINNGNLGIGENIPTYKLHINNGTNGTAIRADAVNGQIRLFDTDDVPSTKFTQIERNNDAFNIHQNDGSGYQHVLTAKMNGNVGIGTTAPTYKLHINNGTTGTALRVDAVNGQIRLFDTDDVPSNKFTQIERNGDAFHIYQNNGSTYQHVLTADMNGNVGIGTTNPQNYRLAVNGNVIAESVKVKLYGNWPDYVFTDEYGLMDINDVEAFINENAHLPNVPSAEEITNNGIDLGEMDAILLQKIEELTLYIL